MRVAPAAALGVFLCTFAWADTFMGLEIEPESTAPYDRHDYPHWIDEDGDGDDARVEVLEVEAVAPGKWLCPFTGQIIPDAGLLDIDHVVPLREAHQSGLMAGISSAGASAPTIWSHQTTSGLSGCRRIDPRGTAIRPSGCRPTAPSGVSTSRIGSRLR